LAALLQFALESFLFFPFASPPFLFGAAGLDLMH
jgi:hypothetical protein